ncbi:hypothetical protein Tco_0917685 [Tanacetum coccineum]
MKKKGRGLLEYKKKQALSILNNGMTFKLELKLMKSLHKDCNQRKERCTLKLEKQAQQRTYMSQYIKNMGSHTLKQLKSYSFDEIKNIFETTIRRVLMENESEKVIPELAAGSSKIDAEEELVQESSKR